MFCTHIYLIRPEDACFAKYVLDCVPGSNLETTFDVGFISLSIMFDSILVVKTDISSFTSFSFSFKYILFYNNTLFDWHLVDFSACLWIAERHVLICWFCTQPIFIFFFRMLYKFVRVVSIATRKPSTKVKKGWILYCK